MFGARKETKPAPPPVVQNSEFPIALAAAAAVAVVGVATALLKKKDTTPAVAKPAPAVPKLELSNNGSQVAAKPALPEVVESTVEDVKAAVTEEVEKDKDAVVAKVAEVQAKVPDVEPAVAQVKATADAVVAEVTEAPEVPIQRKNSISRFGSKLKKSFSTKNGN